MEENCEQDCIARPCFSSVFRKHALVQRLKGSAEHTTLSCPPCFRLACVWTEGCCTLFLFLCWKARWRLEYMSQGHCKFVSTNPCCRQWKCYPEAGSQQAHQTHWLPRPPPFILSFFSPFMSAFQINLHFWPAAKNLPLKNRLPETSLGIFNSLAS